MQNTFVIKYAILHSFATALYVALVACGIYLGSFWHTSQPFLLPMAMLLLLVVSVATVGLLIFCRPVLWYLDGKKKDAVMLVVYTVTLLALYVAVLFIIIAGGPRSVLIQSF